MPQTATAPATQQPAGAVRVLLARQPILDRERKPLGYELLYRRNATDAAQVSNPDAASTCVMLRACVDIGLDRLGGNSPVFINVTRRLLVEDRFLPERGERIVLELLEDEVIDAPLLEKLQQLRGRGFGIALDDFDGKDTSAERRALIQLADYIKFDVLQHGLHALPGLVARMRAYGARLIAEKVETYEQFERCMELGFDGFQGYYLLRPELQNDDGELGENRMSVLRLLAAVQDGDAEAEDLEAVIRTDAVLSYKLLRLVNSAFFGLRTQVDSIRHAVVFLGMQRVRNWAQMLALASLDERPADLMKAALVRARACELMAQAQSSETQGHAFTVGLFSLLDALLGAPMSQLLENLPVAEPVRVALLRREGALSHALRDFELYEALDWDKLHPPERLLQIGEVYIEAVGWAEQTYGTLASS